MDNRLLERGWHRRVRACSGDGWYGSSAFASHDARGVVQDFSVGFGEHNRELAVPISDVLHISWQECKDREANNEECFSHFVDRWSASEVERLELVRRGKVLKREDWVTALSKDDQVREFQYRYLKDNSLVGGDGSVLVSDIESMEIYPARVPQTATSRAGQATLMMFTNMFWMSGAPVIAPAY